MENRKDISQNSIIVGERVAWALARERRGPEGAEQRTSRLMNLRRGALSWTTEGINNAVKYFMDFAECGCGVRSRRTHLSRSGQLQSLMGTNGRTPAANSADDVTCLCEATLTARRTGGQNTGNLQIPLENLALRFASRVKSSLMYAQMLPLYLQCRAYAPTDYQSSFHLAPSSAPIVSIIRI